MLDAYISGWKRAFDYSGRSTRGDYWWFILANIIIGLLLGLAAKLVSQLSALQNLYAIAAIVPGIPLCVRRLRDAGKGWPWIFIGLVPIIGAIWLIVLLVMPSVPG
ncbi:MULTISPECIES: DUF805 domain-containing protein [unclassified Synechococcus]|uniref:DUF805 domain-containing protein n=1 Tax=Synechococcales TaxID=1890424 RepID=UPI002105BAEF|nr:MULTISPECIES: DUF805 domain-containing protein [unclassified Synechococcus]